MRLRLYSSIGKEVPNLVSVQAEDLDFLPTVLVCPIKQGIPETIERSFCVAGNSLYGPLRIGTPHPAPCAPFYWNAGRNDFRSDQAKSLTDPGALKTSSAINSRNRSEGIRDLRRFSSRVL